MRKGCVDLIKLYTWGVYYYYLSAQLRAEKKRRRGAETKLDDAQDKIGILEATEQDTQALLVTKERLLEDSGKEIERCQTVADTLRSEHQVRALSYHAP